MPRSNKDLFEEIKALQAMGKPVDYTGTYDPSAAFERALLMQTLFNARSEAKPNLLAQKINDGIDWLDPTRFFKARNPDTRPAHINDTEKVLLNKEAVPYPGGNGDNWLTELEPWEEQYLRAQGGSGRINPLTGFPKYEFGSESDRGYSDPGNNDPGAGLGNYNFLGDPAGEPLSGPVGPNAPDAVADALALDPGKFSVTNPADPDFVGPHEPRFWDDPAATLRHQAEKAKMATEAWTKGDEARFPGPLTAMIPGAPAVQQAIAWAVAADKNSRAQDMFAKDYKSLSSDGKAAVDAAFDEAQAGWKGEGSEGPGTFNLLASGPRSPGIVTASAGEATASPRGFSLPRPFPNIPLGSPWPEPWFQGPGGSPVRGNALALAPAPVDFPFNFSGPLRGVIG